ncbi:HD-GYP domain-containing protein [Noviherbaspirillum galbum]|uniref:HD-GYP domain-containing protein n=1 Tax=Noviherbaspirillum galbum TaxID=2709383 RepID=A0A6B3SX67_9BURK|nr:HD-GYP domain-containing protein [Noviherbaspirillum galbum]NEX62329.1 HD-GYP domain-containing protein [Noviherbaspirillum galbum]
MTIKKITSDQLRQGMFISDLNCGWNEHPFIRSKFKVTGDETVAKILNAGIKEVYIDTEKGLDVHDAPTQSEVKRDIERDLRKIAETPVPEPRSAYEEELERAGKVKGEATALVKSIMSDVRLGRAIEIDRVQPVVQNITESILRNPGALLGLVHIKDKDDYTFLHSVSVCTLMVAFCRSRGMKGEIVREAGMGGLLHDTGKAKVPDEVLNKPGRLTDEEFAIIRKHPRDGYDILKDIPKISDIVLDITLHHHERCDGTGYPDNLKQHQITMLAQMAAVVDVYDAITADRCYHKGMTPAEGVRKLFEWSKHHFNAEHVQNFMRCVGIYPVGTLVMLESERLALVIEPHPTNMLAPKVKAFFNTRSGTRMTPEIIDLSKGFGAGGGDRILSYEQPAKWGLDLALELGS